MAKESASTLAALCNGNPRVCATINDRLNEVSVPLADLMTYMEERKNKLDRTDELLRKYEEDKRPFEESITAANVALEELEPFGLDEEEGKRQIEKLNVSIVTSYVLLNKGWKGVDLKDRCLTIV